MLICQHMNITVLGFDFGTKYIGVAIGQTITNTASPAGTLRAQDGIPDWQEIDDLINAWKPEQLVVGLPLNMDGSEQVVTHQAKKFANRLSHRYKLNVALVDERLSTWEAKQSQILKSFDQVNADAAVVITEQYLNQ